MLSLLRCATSRTGAVRTGAAHAARSRASRAAPAQQRCYASSTDVEHRVRATSVSHLDLVEIDRYLFRAPREQLWVPPGGRGVFGGQVMGQALRAATLALDGDEAWRCHSNHSYFVHAVDPSRDVLYRVRETSTRRSFATRSIDGIQNGNVIFKMIASFNVDRSLPSDAPPPQHQDAVPEGVPPPEDLPCYRDDIHQALERLPADSPFQSWFRQKLESPVDVRYCEPPPDPLDASPAPRPPSRLMWVKVSRPIDPEADKGNIHQCLAAYISDGPLLSVALQPHGLQFPSTRLGAVASLDHSMWFHAPFRADEWMLYDMRSPRLVDSRGLIFGSVYQDGVLVATVAQEGLLRLKRD